MEEGVEYAIPIGITVRHNLPIKANMVPSFRVIGYYFDQSGNVIADSAWVDVRDECEINVKVSKQNTEIKVSLNDGKKQTQLLPLCFFERMRVLAVCMHA